ncbi:ATPase domain-containing protein [Methanolobus profundi]|uniref:non-specific serine/threonine protein kinase n=1 Tax=Methanolobus profundi TaxID=487685 RepID=A0A1I4TKB2_9EURY|nr:ATPase domain-containing protein [Methanolobus profundi]SFM77164.1 circadian clock protein KaiC [Methanolobus profundi]
MENRSTGIPGFDEILGGGLTAPSTTLIAGNPGSGRTILGIQSLCEAVKNGEKALYICITTKSENGVREGLSNYSFYEEGLDIRVFNISSVERDPLTMLVELGNVVASLKPDRILVDSVTPIGFGFPEAERRRFIYSLSSAIGEWNAIVYLTGTMAEADVWRSVISDVVEGIVYLSQNIQRRGSRRSIKIMKMNNSDYMEGEHTFDISSEGIAIYPRINALNLDHTSELKRIDAGITKFNELSRGGLFELSSTLIAGNTGTGKTSFGLHFIVYGAMNGEPGIISSFEDNPTELRRYAASIGLELEELEQKNLIRIIYTPPSDINSCKHTVELRKNIEEIGAKRVLLDDISGFDYVFEEPVAKREHIANLLRFFKNMGLTSMLISGNRAAGNNVLVAEIPVSSLADVLILLKHAEIDKEIRKTMSILKMHGSDHEKHLIGYDITSEGIQIGEFLKDI